VSALISRNETAFNITRQKTNLVELSRKHPARRKPAAPYPHFCPIEQSSFSRRQYQPGTQSTRKRTDGLLGISAATFAHEVANPLNAISVALEFVESEIEGNPIHDPDLRTTLLGAMREVNRFRFIAQ
jgi:signal transduction histidine kinase